jgi:hypothetical protein
LYLCGVKAEGDARVSFHLEERARDRFAAGARRFSGRLHNTTDKTGAGASDDIIQARRRAVKQFGVGAAAQTML